MVSVAPADDFFCFASISDYCCTFALGIFICNK